MAMDVTGGKTKRVYRMSLNPQGTARIFVTPDGKEMTESEMKAMEGDWTQAPASNSHIEHTGGILSGGVDQLVVDPYAHAGKSTDSKPSLGSLEKKALAPTPAPSPSSHPAEAAATPDKVSMLGGDGGDMGGGGGNPILDGLMSALRFRPPMA